MWRPFWKWWPVEIFRCQESIRDIIIYPHMKCRWNRTMLNLCGIVVVILKMATSRIFWMSWINSGHHNLPTNEMALKSDNVEFVRYCGGHFDNGDRLKFFNVGNKFGTSLSTHISHFDDIGQCWIFVVLWWPFWKWRPVDIFQCLKSILDIIIYPHIKFWWYRTMLNLCGIVATILKMVIRRNFSMLGINWGHHYLPTYHILMISDNVEFLRYCGSHFENGDR